MDAHGERLALRNPFARVSAGEVEQLDGLRRHRQDDSQSADGKRFRRVIDEGGAQSQQAGARQVDLQTERELRRRVDGVGQQPLTVAVLPGSDRAHPERGGPVVPGAAAFESGPAEPG